MRARAGSERAKAEREGPEELEEDPAGWNEAWVAALPEYLRLDK